MKTWVNWGSLVVIDRIDEGIDIDDIEAARGGGRREWTRGHCRMIDAEERKH